MTNYAYVEQRFRNRFTKVKTLLGIDVKEIEACLRRATQAENQISRVRMRAYELLGTASMLAAEESLHSNSLLYDINQNMINLLNAVNMLDMSHTEGENHE